MSGWKGRSKGNVLGYQIFISLIKTFGISPAYFLLKFVAVWYFLFASGPKKNLKAFYNSIPSLGHSNSRLIFKNFVSLGKCLIDRYAFMLGAGKKITYTEEGEGYLKELVNNKTGSVLISGHLGNWDIAGNLLKGLDAKLNVVMFDGEAQKLKAFLEKTVGTPMFNIIPMKNDLSHIFKIKAALADGEVICIHGDRFVEGAKTVETSMFGNKVNLPYGPFQIPSTLKVPYSFVYAIKSGPRSYHFSATKPVVNNDPKAIAQEYINTLEGKVQKHPEQWFNYHQFYAA